MAAKSGKDMLEGNDDLEDETKSSDDASGETVRFWNSRLTHVNTVKDVWLKDELCVPLITGMCMLDSGQIVMCDNANAKLKFLTSNATNVKYDIKCETAPFDVARLEDERVVVTMPESGRLQFVIVKPGAKLDNTITVSGKCYGIDIHEKNIYVCMLEKGVNILSDTGIPQKTIPYESVGVPKYICVSSDDSKMCYCGGSDSDAFVSFVTREGHGLIKFTDGIQSPAGLSLDKDDNILLLDSGANKIYVINNTNGNKQCLLSKRATKYSFTSMVYNIRNKTLVIACSGTKRLDKGHSRRSKGLPSYWEDEEEKKAEHEKEKTVSKVKMYQLESQPRNRWNVFHSLKRKFWKW